MPDSGEKTVTEYYRVVAMPSGSATVPREGKPGLAEARRFAAVENEVSEYRHFVERRVDGGAWERMPDESPDRSVSVVVDEIVEKAARFVHPGLDDWRSRTQS